ncbi:YlmH protein [Streptococcus pneumoniae]|nr:YlmH protein [Streptococcus pneumoniae]
MFEFYYTQIISNQSFQILKYLSRKLCIPIKFEHLTHAKILGTVINQLGIERKLFGDILVDEERAQIMINQQFLLLFQDGLKKIGRIPVSLEERPFTEKIDKLEQYRELDLSVSSFRLDVLLSNVLKLSRNQANQLIEKKLVQVNYHVVDKSDYTVQVGDLISVRKFGRLRLLQDKGQTKKEKKKITVQLLLSK